MVGSNTEAEAAFRSVIATDLDALYRTAMRILRDPSEAEDAVQEALDKAWRKLGPDLAGTRVKPWLFRILINVCLDHLRTKTRHQTVPYDPDAADHHAGGPEARAPDDLLNAKQIGQAIEAEIGRLAADHRTVVQLVIVEGFSYEETATALDLPVGTVRSRLSRARAQLKEGLAPTLADAGHQTSGDPGADGSHLRLVRP